MDSQLTPPRNLPPPQQARSRAALARLLGAAEEVLVSEGPDALTIARVAERAGTSVGAVYRRFTGREDLIDAVRTDLLTRFETAVTRALEPDQPSLSAVLHALTLALADTLAASGRLIPAILAGGRSTEDAAAGLTTIAAVRRRFLDASAPHRNQITHPDPDMALDLVFRNIIAIGAHRAATDPVWPDNLTWPEWAGEIAAMTHAYLALTGTETAG